MRFQINIGRRKNEFFKRQLQTNYGNPCLSNNNLIFDSNYWRVFEMTTIKELEVEHLTFEDVDWLRTEDVLGLIDEWADKNEGIMSWQEGVYNIGVKDIKELKKRINR